MNHKEELNKLKQLEKEIHLGGGIDAIAKHKKKGKLTARERIEKLIDSDFLEIALFAGQNMYSSLVTPHRRGVVCGIRKNSKSAIV